MNSEIFYVITMNTKSNKRIYLKEGKNNSYEWTFDREQAIWFELEEQANMFASDYFKNFKEWYITDLEFDYSTLK